MKTDLEVMRVRLTGVTPLLMHSLAGADPNNPLAQEKKSLTAKGKNKSDADQVRIEHLDWLLGLYLDDEGRIVVPGECLEGMLNAGAKKRKKGLKMRAGVRCGFAWPLIYDGPKDLDALYATPKFQRRAMVSVQRNRIMRVWPKFDKWSVEFEITFRSDVITKKDIADMLDVGASELGFMDYRPTFGQFTWEEID